MDASCSFEGGTNAPEFPVSSASTTPCVAYVASRLCCCCLSPFVVLVCLMVVVPVCLSRLGLADCISDAAGAGAAIGVGAGGGGRGASSKNS